MSFVPKADRPVRRAIAATLLRATLSATALVVLYYTLPFDRKFGDSAVVLLPIGIAVFCTLTWFEMRRIVRSDKPLMRAIQVLATILPFFLILFASVYYVMCKDNAAAFSVKLTRTDSLYFTITVFSTVGFGDIVPVSDNARIVVMVQMLGDLALLGAGVRLLSGAVRMSVERKRATNHDDAAPIAPAEPKHIDPVQ